MKGAQTELNVIVCEDAEDATKKGFVYTAGDRRLNNLKRYDPVLAALMERKAA